LQQSDLLPAKRCTLLRRRKDWTWRAFAEYWAGPHAAIALTMPGIARYTQNRVSKSLWTTTGTAGFDCDGIVELEFQSPQAMDEATASAAVRTLLPEDEERFLEGITLCSVPGGARQVWPGMDKIMLALCLVSPNEQRNLLRLLELSGCVAYSIDPVHSVMHRPRLSYELDPPEFFLTLWFPAGRAGEEAFSPDAPWSQRANKVLRRATAWQVQPLTVVGERD
jgi:hypothetical protein